MLKINLKSQSDGGSGCSLITLGSGTFVLEPDGHCLEADSQRICQTLNFVRIRVASLLINLFQLFDLKQYFKWLRFKQNQNGQSYLKLIKFNPFLCSRLRLTGAWLSGFRIKLALTWHWCLGGWFVEIKWAAIGWGKISYLVVEFIDDIIFTFKNYLEKNRQKNSGCKCFVHWSGKIRLEEKGSDQNMKPAD